ncbi:MAG: hypothetical protein KIS66_10970 [Fimbriimonadaceae bacterium]|nr:hypothetical protein [Fimbriimonadaceae bacterium]
MTRDLVRWGLLAAVLAAMGGCNQGGSSLSKDEDRALRNNLSRELTPEEVARMNSAPAASGAPKDGGPAPAEPPPGKGPR